jgi:hypothetical protein
MNFFFLWLGSDVPVVLTARHGSQIERLVHEEQPVMLLALKGYFQRPVGNIKL